MDIENKDLMPARQVKDLEHCREAVANRMRSTAETLGVDPEHTRALRDYTADLMLRTYAGLWSKVYDEEQVAAFTLLLEQIEDAMEIQALANSTHGRGRVRMKQMFNPKHPSAALVESLPVLHWIKTLPPETAMPSAQRLAQEGVIALRNMLNGYLGQGLSSVARYRGQDCHWGMLREDFLAWHGSRDGSQ